MSAAAALVALRELGVRVSVVGDDLRLGGAPAVLTDALVEQVRLLKPALRAELRAEAAEAQDPFLAWRIRNAQAQSERDGTAAPDPLTYCVEHHRFLGYGEWQRGACTWCVPVDPAMESEYCAGHRGQLRKVGDAWPPCTDQAR